jgi:hypothetical protein
MYFVFLKFGNVSLHRQLSNSIEEKLKTLKKTAAHLLQTTQFLKIAVDKMVGATINYFICRHAPRQRPLDKVNGLGVNHLIYGYLQVCCGFQWFSVEYDGKVLKLRKHP